MKIIADANILELATHLQQIAELELIPGREIRQRHLLQADALLVRSITPVNAELLQGTSIRFVGTATSGTDHVDLDYLAANGIRFADARGSNANAVVEYCFTALAHCLLQKKLDLSACTIGIVGAGNVGRRFAKKLDALQIAYQVCDPPLQSNIEHGDYDDKSCPGCPPPPLSRFCSLDEVLACNVVSLHVPLITTGTYPTKGMIGQQQLERLCAGAILINTCRGTVVNEDALQAILAQRKDLTCVVDVWEGEPAISNDLLQQVAVATPHIAGYSKDAKLAATTMLTNELIKYFQLPTGKSTVTDDASDEASKKLLMTAGSSANWHWQLLLDIFPLLELSAGFKSRGQQGGVAAEFDAMRKQLLSRREFRNYRLNSEANPVSECEAHFLHALGIQIGVS